MSQHLDIASKDSSKMAGEIMHKFEYQYLKKKKSETALRTTDLY